MPATDSPLKPDQGPQIDTLVVIGVGLIGGSVAAGLKKRGACREVVGVIPDSDQAHLACESAVVDRTVPELSYVGAQLNERDLVFVAVPTLAIESVFRDIRAHVPGTVTVTDGASVKGSVMASAQAVYGVAPPQFVPGHPIAGSEKSGVEAANPDLYEGQRVILTPTEQTSPAHQTRVQRLWEALGSEVLTMSVEEHDQVLGATSHLPHAIAYSLVDTLAHDLDNPNIFRYAAGGFRDFTRIASSDPRMWHDIMKANSPAVVDSLDRFIDNLLRLRGAIERRDGDYLLSLFERAKQARDRYTRGQ